MIYMIGGAPRVGKSTLARIILKRQSIPYIACDTVFHMLKEVAPQLGITDKVSHEERAEKFFPFLKQWIYHIQRCEHDYVIEGDSFLPKQVHELNKEYKIKSCFLGVSSMKLETILKNAGYNSWVKNLSQEKLNKLPNWIVDVSMLFKDESKKYRTQFFDLAKDYPTMLEEAYRFLVEGNTL